MEADSHVCLKWNNHQSTVVSVFETLLDSGTLVDCTVAAEGHCLKVHRVILSSCSPFFALLFSQHYEKHPIVVLKDVRFQELRAMVDYMYRGEVNVSQDQLESLLQAAKLLQIKGLSDSDERSVNAKVETDESKETCDSIWDSGAATEHSVKPCSVTQFPRETEVVDLSDDSLPSPHTHETLSRRERDKSTVDCALTMLHSFCAHHENEMGNNSCTTKNHLSTACAASDYPQVNSTISTLAVTPLNSTAVSKADLENNLLEVPENTAGGKCENTLLPKVAVLLRPPEQTTVTLKGPLQKQEPLLETPVKSESEVMDTDDAFANDISRDFTFSDADCAVRQEQQLPRDGTNSISKGTNIEHMVRWASDTYPGLPKSKRPSFSTCRACGKVYKYNRNLTKHLRYECGKEPQFRCVYCPARYTQNVALRKHLEKHHQGYDGVK